MTYQEFLQKLAETPRDWVLIGNVIRRRRLSGSLAPFAYHCPITAACGDDELLLGEAQDRLGLPTDLGERIACAADNDDVHDSAIRRDLLVACGLQE